MDSPGGARLGPERRSFLAVLESVLESAGCLPSQETRAVEPILSMNGEAVVSAWSPTPGRCICGGLWHDTKGRDDPTAIATGDSFVELDALFGIRCSLGHLHEAHAVCPEPDSLRATWVRTNKMVVHWCLALAQLSGA